MSTTRNFQAMLNEYLPNALLKEEMIKRDYFLKNVEKDDSWLGGTLIVPFRGASASTVKLGALPGSTEINQSVYVRGEISTQPEAWASLIFNERDLMEHGKLSEQNFLKILPGELDDLMNYFKMAVSMSFTVGAILATPTGDGQADGTIEVDRVERFELGMPVQLQDDNTAAAKYWVIAVDMNTNIITLSATMGGAAANISAYTTAQNARFYFDGAETAGNRFTSIRNSLLSLANGGDANLYGQSKLAYPYLQAINIDGAGWSPATILFDLFNAQTEVRNKGKGMPTKVVMSYAVFGVVLSALETQKGAFRLASESKSNEFGWTEVEISGVKGSFTLVAIQEMDDDVVFILDMDAFRIYSNGFFKKRKGPDGLEFFTIRNTSGYQYIVDMCFFGDIVLQRPSRCGIVFNIPVPLTA